MTLTSLRKRLEITDSNGFSKVASGATVYIYKAGTESLAIPYSSSEGGSIVSNPITLGDGFLDVYVSAGTYDLRGTHNGSSFEFGGVHAISGDSITGPAGDIIFNTVSDMKRGASSNVSDGIDFSGITGTPVRTLSYDSEISEGSSYLSMRTDSALSEGIIIDGLVNHYAADPDYCFVKQKKENETKPSVSFIFDDATIGHYNSVFPLFESRNIKAGFAVTAKYTQDIQKSTNRSRLTVAELLKMQKHGHEIINHTMTHDNMSLATSIERVAAESETARQWLGERGFNISGFLAAGSQVNQNLLGPIIQSHNYAMTVSSGNIYPNYLTRKANNQYSLARFAMEGKASSISIDAINMAIKTGSAIIMYEHAVDNPGGAYTRLVEVLDYLATIPHLIDIDLPRDLVAKHVGINNNQDNINKGEQVAEISAGWSVTPTLNYSSSSGTITMSPSATGPQTATRLVSVDPSTTYTFSNNVRSSNFAGTISMGVHCLDDADAVIEGFSVEGGMIEFNADYLQRHHITLHTPENCVKIKCFYRINPTSVGSTLLIRYPIICTERKITYEDVVIESGPVEVPAESQDNPFTPNLAGGVRVFPLKLTDATTEILEPVNRLDDTFDTRISFRLRAAATNRAVTFPSTFRFNPNTVFNPNATSDRMIISFTYIDGLWIQDNDTAWVSP